MHLDRTAFRLMCRFAKIAVQRMMEVLLRLTLQYERLALCILQAIFEVSWLAAWSLEGWLVHGSQALSRVHAQLCSGCAPDSHSLR